MKQLKLLNEKAEIEFGGTLNRGKRKVKRPLAFKQPLHFVLKATSPWLLLKQQRVIKRTLDPMSQRFGVVIYKFAVHEDHIHLVVRLHSREYYRRWIRALTSLLVFKIQGLKFALRPYSRVMTRGKQFRTALDYLKINEREGEEIFTGMIYVEELHRRERDPGRSQKSRATLEKLSGFSAWTVEA